MTAVTPAIAAVGWMPMKVQEAGLASAPESPVPIKGRVYITPVFLTVSFYCHSGTAVLLPGPCGYAHSPHPATSWLALAAAKALWVLVLSGKRG